MALSHSIRAAVLVAAFARVGLAGSAAPAQQAAVASTAALSTATSDFAIYLRGAQIGTEQIALARNASGWTITSSGRIGPPLDIVTRSLQIRYDADWKPLELTLDATARGQPLVIHVGVEGTTATTRGNNGGRPIDRTDAIDPDAVLLPNPFFAAYEAVAVRLKAAAPGSTIPVYQGGEPPISIRVGDSQTEQIQTVARRIAARRSHVTLAATAGPELDAEIWADETGRLLRFSVPAQMLEFVRDDLSSVATRRVVISRDGDEQVHVPANGFNLIGTLSKPAGEAGKRLPAVILVAGSGPVDRDETIAGIPVLGQLANALADSGYLVLRYDKRGTGQSGGRIETAGLAEYAEDLRAAITFMANRKAVDPRRLAVVGHSEGGAVALLAAAKDRRVTALALLAATGVTGNDLLMAQQRHLLDRSKLSDADKQAKIDLQKRIHEAVITGKGWDALPAAVRRQVDNAEFQSMLTYDPARIMPDVRQPILIVQGGLDTEVDPSNADRLASLAGARKHPAPFEVARIPGVNHLFVPATTGEVEEYPTLKEKQISTAVASAIAAWLQKTLPASTR
jgi:alpha-beta hydrolase superfamily lysophospholipase